MPSICRVVSTALLPILVACSGVTDPEHVPVALKGCPEWGCTGNSPVIGPYAFHELNLAGIPNLEQVSITSVELAGVPLTVEVVDGRRFVAHDGSANTLEGVALEGVTFHLDTPTGQYLLIIQEVTPKDISPVTMWIGDEDAVETYELVYSDITTPTRTVPVCFDPANHVDNDSPSGVGWGNPIEAVIFTGDRYDAARKALNFESSQDWFNIGCAGSVLAKLLLTRHAEASADADHQTTSNEKQALLKMYTGDMCGTGEIFTLPGTPLRWENTGRWWTFAGTEVGFEAFWDENGAQCITEHRLGDEELQKVIAACGLLPCSNSPGFPTDWPHDAYVKSALPPPP